MPSQPHAVATDVLGSKRILFVENDLRFVVIY